MMAGDNKATGKTKTEKFQFGPWTLNATQSHILKSEGPERERFDSQLELPQFPEMVFANNVLRLEHMGGFGIEFNTLDALKMVDAHHDHLKVAVSQAWQEARADSEHIKDVIKPFDWTYTTEYKGTVFGKDDAQIKVSDTSERIDMEKLMVKEKIMFYADTLLFEDELADNGTSILNVKIRVMPTSFFILMRLFLRVDNVMVRINDTRLYHEAENNYILREFSSRDDQIKNIKAPLHALTQPNEVQKYLTVRKEVSQKLEFPILSTDSNSLPQQT
ncbi:TIP41-like protein [Mizuhopecten yessoensis]|uniref:TIP41-like protein n=1 Tax=Mizuhopecten yessoensis TaxID=6573 RepID=A0A210QSH6_MIZYE|nr:TIP41-like protein [Mizuhopecten yessoensis]XP_021350934.1 TIP41-like protein [Mizuhopecten yessoensis]OWF51675.1 TIP41-like protein [Mizuhopecten yessoensis]